MDTDNLLVRLLIKAIEWDGIWFFFGIRFIMFFINERACSGVQGWLWALGIAFALTYAQ
ncbi:hypothetical protein PV379_05020 [Streptomyces caniscabiei]|uniref:hypothetical protein n=1 Tax=Streptomyces caniscabiei TaxID=2746961 RepID=UPI0029AA9959|nr:hypothetical protein [Streptomyces caniscabiei]MDX2776692.1 hypothetical protein [Streptomyces caniscabiei]